MPLITRTSKGSKLSIAEMDGNLTYLDNKVPYRKYVALLTQSGGSNFPPAIESGPLTKGVTYTLVEFAVPPQPYDFSNVGGPTYPDNFSFVATSNDTPNNYGGSPLGYNTGAPVVTVLENTVGELNFGLPIYWTYSSQGRYDLKGIGFEQSSVVLFGNLEIGPVVGYELNAGQLTVVSYDGLSPSALADDVLSNTFIEIRVYN